MSETIKIQMPDELAQAIEDEYDRRAEELVESMSAHGWDRQSAIVQEHLSDDSADNTAAKAIALLAAETEFDTEEV